MTTTPRSSMGTVLNCYGVEYYFLYNRMVLFFCEKKR